MKRPAMRMGRGDRAFIAWVLGIVLIGALVVRSELYRSSAAGLKGRGIPRDVPMSRLLQRIEMGRLSREPAKYAKPLVAPRVPVRTRRPIDAQGRPTRGR